MAIPTRFLEKGYQLIRRLHKLSDRKWTSALLEEEIFRTTGQKRHVEDYSVQFAKVFPQSHLAVFLDVRIREEESHDSFQQGISLLFRAGRSSEAVLRFFPHDPVLHGLSKILDPAEVEAVFQGLGEEVPEELQVLNYKPELSCVVRYAFKDSLRVVFGKSCPSGLYTKYTRQLALASEAAAKCGGTWKVPRQLKAIPEWGVILQEGLQGECLGARLVNAGNAACDLEAVASVLAAFQETSLEVETTRSFESLFQEQEKHVALLQPFFPRLEENVKRIREEIFWLAEKIPQSPMGLSHGDFASWNIIMGKNGSSVGMIDFDRLAKAECCYDAAYFLQSLTTQSIRRPQHSPKLKQLHNVFRNAYLACARDVSSERLALYEALEITSFVLRNFRKSTLPPGQWEKNANVCLHAAREALLQTRRGL